VLHGTRKNTVNNLLEVGCSEGRIAAIVNLSPGDGAPLLEEGQPIPLGACCDGSI